MVHRRRAAKPARRIVEHLLWPPPIFDLDVDLDTSALAKATPTVGCWTPFGLPHHCHDQLDSVRCEGGLALLIRRPSISSTSIDLLFPLTCCARIGQSDGSFPTSALFRGASRLKEGQTAVFASLALSSNGYDSLLPQQWALTQGHHEHHLICGGPRVPRWVNCAEAGAYPWGGLGDAVRVSTAPPQILINLILDT
jgi:hypothetical protein